jgi:hypothetical protein
MAAYGELSMATVTLPTAVSEKQPNDRAERFPMTR